MKKILLCTLLAGSLVTSNVTRVQAALEIPAFAIPVVAATGLGAAGLGLFDKTGSKSSFTKKAALITSSAALFALCYYMAAKNGFILNGSYNLNNFDGCLNSSKFQMDGFYTYMTTNPYVLAKYNEMCTHATNLGNRAYNNVLNTLDSERQAHITHKTALDICHATHGNGWNKNAFFDCAKQARIAFDLALKKATPAANTGWFWPFKK